MKKKKPYKYNSKSRLTSSSQSFPFKVKSVKKDVKENLENTLTKLHIIEDVQPEKEVLDKGFLEGRIFKKDNKKKKKKEEKEKKNKEEVKEKKEKNEKKILFDEKTLEKISFFRKVFLSVSIVCIILLFIIYSFNYIRTKVSNMYHNKNIVIGNKINNKVDSNYLFVGDFHVQNFAFERYGLDYHYVNKSNENMTTDELLSDMKGNVYDYNPSMVFIEIGTIDLRQGKSEKKIYNNYKSIIESIKKNRPYATIIIEAVYPINSSYNEDDITNNDIKRLNDSLRSLAIEENIQYFDAYSILSKNDELNSKYSNDGIHLNNYGYSVLYNNISKLIG